MLAVSSSFLSRDRTTPLETRVAMLVDLPVETLVLAPGWHPSELHALADTLRRQHRVLAAIENFCATPPDSRSAIAAETVLSLASQDDTLRQRALVATVDTLEHADRVGAPRIIVEGGLLPTDDTDRRLLERLAEHARRRDDARADLAEATRLRELWRGRRALRVPRALDALLASLDVALTHADRLEVEIALRGPGAPDELLAPPEQVRVLREFRGSRLSVWHDLARARQRSWWLGEDEILPTDAALLSGLDLVDQRTGQRGLLPGEGDVAFTERCASLAPTLALVVRPPEGTPAQAIVQVLEQLRALGLEGPPPQPWEDHLPRIG